MERDSQNNEKIVVGDLSIENNKLENVENDQNVLNCNNGLGQLKNETNEIIQETLVTEKSLEKCSNKFIITSEKEDSYQADTEAIVENEDEFNFHCKKKIKSNKFTTILDSDSDDEVKSIHTSYEIEEKNNPLETFEKKKDVKNGECGNQNKKLRRIALIDDSDSDECTSNTPEKSLRNNEEVENSNLKSELNLFNEEDIQLTHQRKILSALCDSESSDDNSNENKDLRETAGQISDSEMEALQGNEVFQKKSRQLKSKKMNDLKQEKMTAKKALEQKKEIFSESQRRIRESNISLPYHKPKPRSLKEFLENRPKLSSALINVNHATSPSTAIKMSTEQLEILSKKLKEREKEVQQFYKSESESDNEDPNEHSANMELDVLTTEVVESNSNEVQTATHEKCNSINDICPDNVNSNVLLKETDVNQLSEIIDNSGSKIDKVNQHFNDNCANAGSGDNMEESDMKNSSKSTLNDNEHGEIIYTVPNMLEANLVSNPKNSEEVNNIDNVEYDKNVEEKQNIDKSESQDSASFHLEEHVEKKKIERDEVEEFNDENEYTPKVEDELIQDAANECVTNVNLDETDNIGKLIILSDVIVKPSTSKKIENVYDLDDEILDLASEIKDKKNESDNYDFNLDDLEDEFEHNNGEAIERTNDKHTDEEQCQLPKRKKELLEKLGDLKPRLSCGPNEIIDLENGLTLPDEISKLRDRFLQHNIKIGKNKHKKEISILSVSDGKIHKETLALNIDEDDEENTAPLEKPGVRLQQLREKLEHQMAKRRSDMWKEKLDQSNTTKQEIDEKSDAEDENSGSGLDILDNDEEEEFTESEVEDEELEEDDYDMSDKAKKMPAFIDREAEESDAEEEGEEIQLKESDEEVDMNEQDVDGDNDEVDADDDDEEMIELEVPKKKVLKRIITAIDDEDSDDEDTLPQNKSKFPFTCGIKEKRVNSDEECLTPHQPVNYKIREPVLTPTKSENAFLTPITYMTGIQNLNTSGSRIVAPIESSPVKQFADEIALESQDFDCNFPSTQSLISSQASIKDTSLTNTFDPPEQNILSTQDVLDVCSGNFPTSTQATSEPEMSTQQLKDIFSGVEGFSHDADFNTQQLGDICSGQFTGVPHFEKSCREEVALDESEENIISQLIDEEELEKFKKKFESPLPSYTQKTIDFENTKEVEGTGGIIDSEDDDDELHLKKKKNKKLNFSDEESDNYSEEEEIIDLHDKDSPSNVEYDSEENEIDPESADVYDKSNNPGKIKITDFLEAEAELSESEWGSEDEDEKNLDDMEFEKGDEEKFDEEMLRSDIERVQMRQMLDEDNREVKLLQELLLEDGELHGSGRQRQFRWKNIDEAGNEIEEAQVDDGDTYHDEDEESEEQWRKMRHEREMFMLKKQSQEDEDSVLIESQKLSFTHKSLKIKNQTPVLTHTTSEENTSSLKIKQPFKLLNKRGSFLSRSEQILQKFAETTKVSVGNKTSNRIVFQTIDGELKKRKASTQDSDSTPVALKKLRLSGLSPALQKIKPKLGKTLFEDFSID